MTGSIETVTDKNQFGDIFQKYFSGKNVFLKTKSGDLSIRFLGYSEENAAFRIPRIKNVPDMILILTRHGASTIYASLKYVENKEDTFVFIPVKFQVITEERRENRTSVTIAGSDKNIILIENIISDSLIQNLLMSNEKKLDNLKDSIKFDLEKKFERIRIVFLHEAKNDQRMKQVLEKGTTIFIPDMSEKPDEKREKEFNDYINEIYAKDYKLANEKDFISEITIPIFFRSIIPYGYVQVNSKKAMSDMHLTIIKRTGIVVSEFIRKHNLFLPVADKFLVSDLSRGGLGIAFRDRKQTRFYRQDSLNSFDLILPSSKKVNMGAVVRNIVFNQNGIIRIGFEIKYIDALSEVNYEEYLDSLEVPS